MIESPEKREPRDLRDLSFDEIEAYIFSLGEKPYRAKQIWDWLYQKDVESLEEMKNIPESLVMRLSCDFAINKPEAVKVLRSRDHTVKVLYRLKDNQTLETVYIPTKKRLTVCVSTQAGCKFGCKFCASGVGGFVRNLDPSEIVNQILGARNYFEGQGATHIVFMGMGEPLDNYDNVLRAIRVINSSAGLNIGARRITLSTCGIIPGIQKLADEGLQVELAISLHGYDDASRNELMPVNRQYSFDALVRAAKEYYQKTKRQITFEYVLIKEFTLSVQAVSSLKKVLSGFDCKLNLIPYNSVEKFSYISPSSSDVQSFQKSLSQNGIHATIRHSRGSDVSASCGQLRSRYL